MLLMVGCYDDSAILDRLEALENGTANLVEQNNALQNSIKSLETVRHEVTVAIQELEQKEGDHSADIEQLKNGDKVLQKGIDDLTAQLNKDIVDGKSWAQETFVTIDVFNTLVTDIDGMRQQIGDKFTEVESSLNQAAESIKLWVNEALKAFYTSAQLDEKLQVLKDSLTSMDTRLDRFLRVFKISFAESEVVFQAGETKTVSYIIEGSTPSTKVRTLCQNGWAAEVRQSSESTGAIIVTAPTPFVEDEIVVIVDDGEYRTIVSSIKCVNDGSNPSEEDVIPLVLAADVYEAKKLTDISYTVTYNEEIVQSEFQLYMSENGIKFDPMDGNKLIPWKNDKTFYAVVVYKGITSNVIQIRCTSNPNSSAFPIDPCYPQIGLSKLEIKADGIDAVTISAIPVGAVISCDQEPSFSGKTFTTSKAGTYTFKATYNGKTTLAVSLRVKSDSVGPNPDIPGVPPIGNVVWVAGLKDMPTFDQWGIAYDNMKTIGLKYEPYYGWYDIKKLDAVSPSHDDHRMCWAATCSNMLQWWYDRNKENVECYIKYKQATDPSYVAPKYSYNTTTHRASDIFDFFKRTTLDKGGWPAQGLKWYLRGERFSNPGDATSVENTPESDQHEAQGGFFGDVYKDSPIEEIWQGAGGSYKAGQFYKDALERGDALGIDHQSMQGNHAITVWGVAFDEYGELSSVFVCDNNHAEAELTQGGSVMRPGKISPFGIFQMRVKRDSPTSYTYHLESSTVGTYGVNITGLESLSQGKAAWDRFWAKHPDYAPKTK